VKRFGKGEEKMGKRKIGVVGTHGVGKTSLCKNLATLFDCSMVAEVARTCPLPINQVATAETQWWILKQQIWQEMLTVESGKDVIICDRTTLDQIAYIHDLYMRGVIKMGDRRELMRLATNWIGTYDAFIFVRPDGKPPKDDGVRDTDPDFQRRIDGEISRLLQGHLYAEVRGTKAEMLSQAGNFVWRVS
jgi:nicotinamide riboside kinase